MSSSERQSNWPPHIQSRVEGKNTARPAALSNVQGVWENGAFRFYSPNSVEEWRRKSYQQGISENNWHLGQEVDDKTRDLALAGLGGPMPATYQGPDGKYRYANIKTIEDKSVRDHRLQHIKGKTIDQIAAAKMPGEDEYVANHPAAQRVTPPPVSKASDAQNPVALAVTQVAANDNSAKANNAVQAAALAAVEEKSYPVGFGRFGTRPKLTQADEDKERLLLQGITGNSADNIRATSAALERWWNGESWSEAYSNALAEEERQTDEARRRLGLTGIALEAAPGFVPILGDAAGAVADAKDFLEHGDEWGWTDYGLVAAGLLPWVPSRGLVKKSKKAVEKVLDDGNSARRVGDEVIDLAKSNGLDTANTSKRNLDEFLPNHGTNYHTEAQARNLPGENRGLIYVLEAEPAKPHAAWYQGETPGSVWSVEHQKPAVPALRADNPDGVNYVKFDGIEKAEDGDHLILIDSKTKIDPDIEPAREGLKSTLRRVGSALRQNNDPKLNGPKFKVFYDFPSEEKAKEALDVVKGLGYSDVITVRIRIASKWGQEKFKKLREK